MGGRIVPLIAPFSIKPRPVDSPFPLQGGLPCSFPGASGWGTAGAFVKQLEIQVPNGGPYNCSANYVVLSCNHVIADNDQRGLGAPVTIGVYGQPQWADAYLHCWIPVHEVHLQMDFAAGDSLTPRNYDGGVLRGIGEASWNLWNAADSGEKIQKSGAKTGVTKGVTLGRRSIQVWVGQQLRTYFNVWEAPSDFADHGDSGSIVVGNNLDVVGMVAWKDDQPGGGTFFYTLGPNQPGPSVTAGQPDNWSVLISRSDEEGSQTGSGSP